MIKKVTIRNFKRFKDEVFDTKEVIILAGANNSGKTTLLQAIAVWNLALQKWLAERGPESGSKARKRTGVAITRQSFTTIPLREMNLLWTDRSTALRKDELHNEQKLGTPRLLEINLSGKNHHGDWSLTFEFTYRYPDLIHVRPAKETPIEGQIHKIKDINIVHVPPFSGIGAEETRYDRPYRELLIGQGKPGDILRNLLLDINRDKPDNWEKLQNDIEEIFGYHILPPQYEGLPFIVCEYMPGIPNKQNHKNLPKLDISTAGSGFLQVLMLLGFFYARSASILMFDEPDAHLHVILQRQIYDRLRQVARNRDCQLLIATHSEVLIDSTSPEKIISFFRHPHKLLSHTERAQVREAIKRLTSLDLLLAEQAPGILYLEGETDLNLLREWARILGHSAYEFLSQKTFWHGNRGRNPKEARAHYFALKAIQHNIRGILLLDGDNRQLPDHELATDGLSILRWKRYEVENYLIHPNVLDRFVRGSNPDLFSNANADSGMEYLRNQLPPAVFNDPLSKHEYLTVTPASKTLLPSYFKASKSMITKNEYYQIASIMNPEEIVNEVTEKLDAISKLFSLSN